MVSRGLTVEGHQQDADAQGKGDRRELKAFGVVDVAFCLDRFQRRHARHLILMFFRVGRADRRRVRVYLFSRDGVFGVDIGWCVRDFRGVCLLLLSSSMCCWLLSMDGLLLLSGHGAGLFCICHNGQK